MSVILIIIVAGVLILILAFLKSYTYLVNREFEPDEEIIGESNNEKKALVLYVPSKHDSATIVKDNVVRKLNSKGYTVHVNFPSVESSYDYSNFDFICYITPIYMKRVSRPLCEVMVSSKYQNKSVAIISVGGQMNSKDELNYMKKLLDPVNSVSLIKVKKDSVKVLNDFIEGAIV